MVFITKIKQPSIVIKYLRGSSIVAVMTGWSRFGDPKLQSDKPTISSESEGGLRLMTDKEKKSWNDLKIKYDYLVKNKIKV